MKKTYKLFATGLIMSILVFACSKEDNLTPQESSTPPQVIVQGVKVQQGHIAFATLNDFKATIAKLKTMTEPERNEWDAKISFISMQEFYNENRGLIEGDTNPTYKTEKGIKPYIPDVLFAHILNADGVYQVGDEVHRILKEGKEIAIDKGNANLLMTDTQNPLIKSKQVSVQLKWKDDLTSKKAKTDTDLLIAGAYFNGDARAIALFSVNSWWIYNSFAMKLQMQTYTGWWIFKSWGLENASHLEINNAGFFMQDVFGASWSASGQNGSCDNCSEAYVSLDESFGVPLTYATFWNAGGYFNATWNGQTVNFAR